MTEKPTAETPLIAAKLDGIRSWSPVLEGAGETVRLGALGRWSLWPTDRPMRAVCVGDWDEPLDDHAAPHPDCACGIYAFHPDRFPYSRLHEGGSGDVIFGAVRMWGRTEVHIDGLRAEYAEPYTLLIPPRASERYLSRVTQLGRLYGLETLEIAHREDFDRYIGARLRGLNEDAVWQLVGDRSPAFLKARATTLRGRHGLVLAGFGYLPKDSGDPSPVKTESRVPLAGALLLRVRPTADQHALGDRRFDPGNEVKLIPDRTSRGGLRGIGVWDPSQTVCAGELPRHALGEVVGKIGAGRIGRTISAWHWRDLRSGERTALHVLITGARVVRMFPPMQLGLGEQVT